MHRKRGARRGPPVEESPASPRPFRSRRFLPAAQESPASRRLASASGARAGRVTVFLAPCTEVAAVFFSLGVVEVVRVRTAPFMDEARRTSSTGTFRISRRMAPLTRSGAAGDTIAPPAVSLGEAAYNPLAAALSVTRGGASPTKPEARGEAAAAIKPACGRVYTLRARLRSHASRATARRLIYISTRGVRLSVSVTWGASAW